MIRINSIKHYSGALAEMPQTLPYGDTYFTTDTKKLFKYDQNDQPVDVSEESESQGYFGLLTDFYFGGNATDTVVSLEDVDTWLDVNFITNPDGRFDKRPDAMKEADVIGYDETSQFFNLEGLTTDHFGAFRASMSFDPDEDNGEISARLQFERHSGTIPNDPK